MNPLPSESRRTRPTAAILALLLATTGAIAHTQESPPWQPPMFAYGDGVIDVLEAVRLTLQNDPNLLLQEQDVRAQEGVLQQLSGVFDWTLGGAVSYQYREQEVRESIVEQEQERRTSLELASREACADRDHLLTVIERLEQARTQTGVEITDFTIDNQLRIIEALIAQTPDPAQRQTLQDLRQTFIAREIAAARESAQILTVVCEETAATRARIGDVPEFEYFRSASLSLNLDRLFRTGVFFSPFLESSYEHTEYVGKGRGFFEPFTTPDGETHSPSGIPLIRFIDFGGKNIPELYSTSVGFDVNFPLLRGRGRAATGASERAAEIDLEATALVYKHGASVSALQTLRSYWNLLGAQEQVAVLERSVTLHRQLLEIVDILIDADQVPRAERSRSLASLASAQAQLEGARQGVIAARLALARAMGVDVESVQNAPLAQGPFPPPPGPGEIEALTAPALVATAVDNRFDVQAVRAQVEAGAVLTRAAELDLQALLDLSGGVWATARGEDSLSNSLESWRFPSWSVGLRYERPFGNNFRRGVLVQHQAQLAQGHITSADVERRVAIGVVQTMASLHEALDRLHQAQEAARHFQQTIDAELERLRFGQATLVDAILTEQQSTGAFLAVVTAQQQVANLVAQLRFETGTLVEQPEEGPAAIARANLVSLPSPGAGQ